MIRAISPMFCVLVLLGQFLIYTAVAFQLWSTDDALCNVSPAATTIGIGLVMGNIIAKNQRIWQLFGSPLLFRKGLPDAQILRISMGLVLIDVVLVVLWLGISPFRSVRVINMDYEYRICLPAVTEGLTIDARHGTPPNMLKNPMFLVVCLYNGLLIAYAALLAWNTRKIPVKGYNESKAISISVYNIVLGYVK
jgi:hypothetical protein